MRLQPVLLPLAIVLGVLAMALLALARYAGIPLQGIPQAPAVGAGLAAKLACSGRFLSGYDEARIAADIIDYSPALQLVSLDFSAPDRVSASLLGTTATARYYPGLGCTLDAPGMPSLAAIRIPALPVASTLPLAAAGDTALQVALEEILQQDNDQGLQTRALLIARSGAIVAEAYAEGVSPEAQLLGWSMGKSLTGLMIGRLAALGQLRLEERRLFPQWERDARSEVSIEDLLQMRSGLAFSETYLPGNDSTRMLFTAASAAAVALDKPLAYPPGEHFAYSSGTTNILCHLLGQRLGGPQALVDFFAREVAVPLGLQDTTLELDPSGDCVGSSYVYASARDWARMAQPLIHAGRVGEQQWLPAGWVERATAPNGSDNDSRYGYQLWLNRGAGAAYWPGLPASAFAMSGHSGQVVMMLPTLDAVIVRLGWSSGEYPVDQRFAPLLDYLHEPAAVFP
ncbi:serine hydrolase domain-containing protein [Haliea sp. E17]|uniref:serine hydrolase domain-containing protein n=1 Tax=Haliea sp. E17 TaxID=3401576 RepID=UPI003AB0BB25